MYISTLFIEIKYNSKTTLKYTTTNTYTKNLFSGFFVLIPCHTKKYEHIYIYVR